MKKYLNLVILTLVVVGMLFTASCNIVPGVGNNDEDDTSHKHTCTSTVVPATCSNEGYTLHVCDECGYEYRDSFVEAHEHQYESYVVEPTCDSEGYTSHVCSVCDYAYQDTFVSATGHEYNVVISKVANLESELGKEMIQCEICKRVETSTSSVNSKEVGVDSFSLGLNDRFRVYAETGYTSNEFILNVDNVDNHFSGTLYFSFNADYGLFYRKAFKLDFNSEGVYSVFGYENGSYPYAANNVGNYKFDADKGVITFKFLYSNFGLTSEEALGNFAFYLVMNERDKSYEYKDINPYVLPGYSQTWIKVNAENRFYYTTKYQKLHAERLSGEWSMPDITKADINWTHICRAETPEEAVVSTMIAEENGCTNVDVNLLYLKPIYRNVEDMEKIFHAFKNIGTIAVYYDSSVSQQARLDLLKKAVVAGCGGVDMQGFMFHEGSTLDTHTSENIKYWEDKGFDMCFIAAGPKETTIDPTEVEKQMNYVNEIHELGGKVLISCHVSAEFTRRQAVAYGEFLDYRGVDIIKVVSTASDKISHDETVLANRDAYYSDKIKAKYSIHCTGKGSTDISRIVGPLFYHCYMAFHYNYLCKLQMIMDFMNSGIVFDDTLSVREAIESLRGHTIDPEYESLYNQYKNLAESTPKAYALGKNSDMSDRWSFNGDKASMVLRSATGSNSFSIRGAAYSNANYSNNFEYETSITGNFKPYSASTRVPKFGIFLGDQQHMLALTYNFVTDSTGVAKELSVALYTNSYLFGYDTETKDALDTIVVASVPVSSNVVNGDPIRLKVKYENGNLTLYYSTLNSGEMIELATLEYSQIKDYYSHNVVTKDVYFGNVFEVYLGSNSVGFENRVDFQNIIIKK